MVKAPTYEEWEVLGDYLSKVHGAVQWWVGDWLNIGEERFGERAAQAMDATGWEFDTLMQYRRVCAQIPLPRRIADLSFFHHREVADLDATGQAQWLARAQDGEDGTPWTSARLRRELNQAKATADHKLWVIVECKDPQDQETLLSELKAQGRTCKAVER